MKTNYLILGTGQLGLAIMDELVAQGKSVRLANRSGTVKEPLPAGVTVTSFNVNDPDSVAKVSKGADIVFFCTQPAYHRWPEEFPPMATSLIEGLAGKGIKLVFGSNLYMYGPTNGATLHEDLPYKAETRKGKARALVANLLMDAHQAGKLSVTIGRASDFYGPRVTDSAAGEMVFEAALDGKPVNMIGKIDLPHTLTYIRDFARALVTLSAHEDAYGRIWHVPSAETISLKQFLGIVENEVGQPVKTRVASKTMLRMLGLFNPTVKEMVEIFYEFDEPFVVDHSRFAQTFGVTVTPHETAVRETIAWYRQNHQ